MRMYNGCPGPELKAVLDHQSKRLEELQRLHPNCRVVYFPMAEVHSVWDVTTFDQISDEFRERLDAIEDAIEKMRKRA